MRPGRSRRQIKRDSSYADHSINLTDRVAIVTGEHRAFGRSSAGSWIPARLVVSDVNPENLGSTGGELQAKYGARRVKTAKVDIADHGAVERAVADIVQQLDRLDILVNNATFAQYPLDAWRDVMNVDINGRCHYCGSVAPVTVAQNYGRIVNVASIAGKEGNANASACRAAKAAVIALTKSLGKELAGSNIAVNCVTPAVARTPGAMQQAQHETNGKWIYDPIHAYTGLLGTQCTPLSPSGESLIPAMRWRPGRCS